MKFADMLLKYIENNFSLKSDFGAAIGISATMVSRYLHEDVLPSYKNAIKIYRLSNHEISMEVMGYESPENKYESN